MPSSWKILQRYYYDALDRLSATGLSAQASAQRFYQGNHLVTELEEHSRRTIFRSESRPMAQQKGEAGVSETTLMKTDQAHSILETVSTVNTRQFAYTAYGHHPSANGASSLLGFNGEHLDELTARYPLGQGKRFFNPTLMRFNSPDELSPFDQGGINSYAYCENDPINFHDPTGKAKSTIFFRTTRSRASVIVKHRSNSVIMKHSSAIGAPSQTASTLSSSISANRNPLLNELLDQAPTPMQPGPSRTDNNRVTIPNLQLTPHKTRRSATPSRMTLHKRGIQDAGIEYDALRARTPGFIATGTPGQAMRLSDLNARLKLANTIRTRDHLLHEIRLTVNRIKRDNLPALTAHNNQIRNQTS